MKKKPFINQVFFFISLMVFWIIMSGYLDAIHIGMGVISIAFVMILMREVRDEKFFADEMSSDADYRLAAFIPYLIWLIVEILKSGFNVVLTILKPSLPIEPAIVRFKVDLPNTQAKIILGNSITLTPGTLTIEIEDDEFVVHAFTKSSYEGILDDTMPKKVLGLFEKSDRPVVSDVKIYTSREELA